ncbi:NUDIX domain-containing protein [Granulicella sp. dw_53]|uniref:NUDIX hydrolase n=1 Tax=Granulicella sp. dw_53 TaxID=2719792 RepID=UPI001BD49345|nr:NUDIX domain-containing protein [Granulicella sp. dw_53]
MKKSSKRSAGLLMYRKRQGEVEVFLVHPGGPFWARKDQGAWTIPKGEYENDEEPLAAAQREFLEETGFIATGSFIELGSIRQKSGKVVIAWAVEGDCDPTQLKSNICEIEWPPKSGKRLEIPEIDRGSWFSSRNARTHIRSEQIPLLEALESWIAARNI